MEVVKKYASKLEIEILRIPKGMGHLFNPCDNYFHDYVKKKYRQYQASHPLDAEEKKIEDIRKSYYSVNESTIKKLFFLTGSLGTKPVEDVVDSVLVEGLKPKVKGHAELMEKQKKAFVAWCEEKDLDTFSV